MIGGEPRHHQSAPSGSQFELAILETLAKIGELLESMTPRVEGSDSSGLTPSGVSQTSGFSRDCHGVAGCQQTVGRLTWPDKNSTEKPSAQPLVNMSESTVTTIRMVFRKLLSNIVGKGMCKLIMAYSSTPYVGMAPNKNGGHIKSAHMTRSKCLC